MVNPSFVNISFINQKKINAQSEILDTVTFQGLKEDTINSIWLDSSRFLNDSLSRLQIKIDTGGVDFPEERNRLETLIESVDIEQREQQIIVDSIATTKTSLQKFIDDMKNGLILISAIKTSASDSSSSLIDEDSTNSHILPFSSDTSIKSATYFIDITDTRFVLTIPYENEIIVDNTGSIRTVVFGLDTLTMTKGAFDSLKLNCNDNRCTSNEATITAYF